MGSPYSDDLRERVVAAIEAGHTRVKVAELYNMALSTVGGFIKRKRETGSISPDKFGEYETLALEGHTALAWISTERNWPNVGGRRAPIEGAAGIGRSTTGL
jgi:transposase